MQPVASTHPSSALSPRNLCDDAMRNTHRRSSTSFTLARLASK
jgi:hypothetical protein